MEIITSWWGKLIFLLFLVPIIMGFLNGFDRIITARLQGRKGPPLLQPFYDLIKLFAKVPTYSNAISVVYLVSYLVFSMVTLYMLLLGMDFLLILFTATLTAVSFVMAGMSFKSPYSQIGSHRELIQLISYEPVLILTAFGIYGFNSLHGTPSFSVAQVFTVNQPMFFYLPLLFFALTIILTIKLRKSPFDLSTSHHGHQEIVKGITTELAGRNLAISEIAHWYEQAFILALIVIFFANILWVGLIVAFVLFLMELVLDNVTPRLTYKWMLKATWTSGIAICSINLLWLYLIPLFRG